MKQLCIIICLAFFSQQYLSAQNTGFGTTEPMNKVHIVGNLLVNQPTIATATAPTTAQTKTMVNGSTIDFPGSDSTCRIYDPGGQTGDYLSNLTCYASISSFPANNLGIELTIVTMGMGTGDSLIIKESSSSNAVTLLAVGNGYTSTGKFIFNTQGLYLIFKSNTDANNGPGFSLLFRRLYDNSLSAPDIAGAVGKAFYFDTKNGSLRSGYTNNSIRGDYSIALGGNNVASGNYSTALGTGTKATGLYSTAFGIGSHAKGDWSTAMGYNTTADGLFCLASGNNSICSGIASFATGLFATATGSGTSVSMGDHTTATGNGSFAVGYYTTASGTNAVATGNYSNASGNYSTAMGAGTLASGNYSTAMGTGTTASGTNSTALGNFVSTNNQTGAFVIGDNSTAALMTSTTPNTFRARFANGYRLYTSSNLTTNCLLSGGANAWSTASDVHLKENFADINGEEFLKSIAAMKLTSWNYKTQDAKTFRHYGPMAQDFYAAFGKDKFGTIGNDSTINSADFDGINLVAIQALEKRTARQKLENEELKDMLLLLRKELDELKKVKHCDCPCPQNL